jgi:transcriptional regulator with XRE-family HTH domain
MNFGDLFRNTREELGMSQVEFARELGISQPTVSKIRNGKDVSGTALVRLEQLIERRHSIVCRRILKEIKRCAK